MNGEKREAGGGRAQAQKRRTAIKKRIEVRRSGIKKFRQGNLSGSGARHKKAPEGGTFRGRGNKELWENKT